MTIREYRDKKGLTQDQLAKELAPMFKGIDSSLISKFENGVCQPPIDLQAYISAEETEVKPELTETQEIIYSLLKHSEAPVSRATLCFFCQQDDRSNRLDIADMRRKGIRICSSSRSKGYWLAQSQADYETLRAEYLARIRDMSEIVRAMDSYTEGQVRM